MNLNQLQYFLTLSKLEHYTQAAKELKIDSAKSEPCHERIGGGTGNQVI